MEIFKIDPEMAEEKCKNLIRNRKKVIFTVYKDGQDDGQSYNIVLEIPTDLPKIQVILPPDAYEKLEKTKRYKIAFTDGLDDPEERAYVLHDVLLTAVSGSLARKTGYYTVPLVLGKLRYINTAEKISQDVHF